MREECKVIKRYSKIFFPFCGLYTLITNTITGLLESFRLFSLSRISFALFFADSVIHSNIPINFNIEEVHAQLFNGKNLLLKWNDRDKQYIQLRAIFRFVTKLLKGDMATAIRKHLWRMNCSDFPSRENWMWHDRTDWDARTHSMTCFPSQTLSALNLMFSKTENCAP